MNPIPNPAAAAATDATILEIQIAFRHGTGFDPNLVEGFVDEARRQGASVRLRSNAAVDAANLDRMEKLVDQLDPSCIADIAEIRAGIESSRALNRLMLQVDSAERGN